MSIAVNDRQVEEYDTRFQAWLREMNKTDAFERFFGEMSVSLTPDHDAYGRNVTLWDDDGQALVRIDEVTVYGAREAEVSATDFDDELVLTGDWEAVAAALTEKHFGEWFFGDESGVGATLAAEAADAADVPFEVAEPYIEVSEYHRSPTFTAEYAEELAHQYVPEIAVLAGLAPQARVERVIEDFASHLTWLGMGTETFSEEGRTVIRFTVEPEYEEEYVNLLAEQARVYDDEAELHIQFTTAAEVDA